MIKERKNWAITGATGRIGQLFLERAKRETDLSIVVFDRSKGHELLEPATMKDLVAGADVVVHLAGKILGEKDERTGQVSYVNSGIVNTYGTQSLCEALKAFGKSEVRLIFTSSFAVYAPQYGVKTLTENSQVGARNVYGVSKFGAEEFIRVWTQQGGRAAVLRLSSVYGPGFSPDIYCLVATFAKQIAAGETIEVWGDGTQEKDLIYVDDVVEALVRAAKYEQGENFEVYNICAGSGVSVNRVIELLGEYIGKEPKVKYQSEKKKEASQFWLGDSTRAKEILGWEPKISLEEGLKRIVAGGIK